MYRDARKAFMDPNVKDEEIPENMRNKVFDMQARRLQERNARREARAAHLRRVK